TLPLALYAHYVSPFLSTHPTPPLPTVTSPLSLHDALPISFVETNPADDLVRQPGADEHVLEDTGLGVGPVEHRHLPGGDFSLVGETVDLVDDEHGLLVLVVGDVADQGGALTLL